MLRDEFLRLCNEWAKREDVLHTEVKSEKRVTCFSIYYRSCRVELVYSRKWESMAPPSVLYARIYLNKNDPMYLHLPEMITFLNLEDYRACYFPYIESILRMKHCFSALVEILRDYIPKAEQLGFTGEDRAIKRRWLTDGFPNNEKKDSEEATDEDIDWELMLWVRERMDAVLVSRYTSFDAYHAFLCGDRKKAIQKYRKLKKDELFAHEIGLLAYLQSDTSRDFVPISPQCFCAPEYKKGENGDLTDLKGIAILYCGFSCIFCSVLAVINAILAHGTVYFCGAPWWMGFLLAALPAMFGYFAFRRSIRMRLGGGVAFQDIQKSEKFAQNLARIVFALTVIGCLLFLIFIPPMSSRYYDSYALCYTDNEKIERFEYAQVTEVYHIDARYNVYGERIDRDSYVLMTADGRHFDMDSDADAAQQLVMIKKLLPEVKITELDSDKEIP